MLRIEIKDGNIEKGLKTFKHKTRKTKQIQMLRENKEFIKPSVAKRAKLIKAKYVEQKFKDID